MKQEYLELYRDFPNINMNQLENHIKFTTQCPSKTNKLDIFPVQEMVKQENHGTKL